MMTVLAGSQRVVPLCMCGEAASALLVIDSPAFRKAVATYWCAPHLPDVASARALLPCSTKVSLRAVA